jgi:hypothetical protein
MIVESGGIEKERPVLRYYAWIWLGETSLPAEIVIENFPNSHYTRISYRWVNLLTETVECTFSFVTSRKKTF